MSWDATLYQEYGPSLCDVNYTHNTSCMIYDVLGDCLEPEESWWQRLDGMDGPTSAKYLDSIIGGLKKNPEKYRAMNPDNGWGDYDGLLRVLEVMRESIPSEARCKWSCYG